MPRLTLNSRKTLLQKGGEKEDWKKFIRVGDDYQVEIPTVEIQYDGNEIEQETLVWAPNLIPEIEVEQFLKTACSYKKSVKNVRDNETALKVLWECDLDVKSATEKFVSSPGPSNSVEDKWTAEEIDNFETGVSHFRKRFLLVQKWYLKNKTMAEIVEFYYFWKKTERYEVFMVKKAEQKKVVKKNAKFEFTPGVSDYMSMLCKLDKS